MTDTYLDSVIRKVKDFPKPGILFYDVTGILTNPDAFRYCINKMEKRYADTKIDAVAAIEARGFIFAAPFAEKRGLPLVLVRKQGKLPGECFTERFSLEYGEDEIEIHKSDIHSSQRILIVDDLIATGGTLEATKKIIKKAGAEVLGIFAIIGLPFLEYEKRLNGVPIQTLIQYHAE